MRTSWRGLVLVAAFGATHLFAQIRSDVLGVHDLSPAATGTSPVTGRLSGSCYYCHAPHSGVGGMTPLWNQKLSTEVYTPYTSSTYSETGASQPPQGTDSVLCLSCHDGSVALGTTQAYGSVPMSGSLKAADINNTQSSHPLSMRLPLKDAPYLSPSLVSAGKTADVTGAVKLIKGNIECTTCHSAHIQAIDTVNQKFLVRDSSSGQMCLACHDPARVMSGQTNPLSGWTTSAHAIASNTTTNVSTIGPYRTVAQNACISCHQPHNAPGSVRLLRGPNEQACVSCHGAGSSLYPAAPDVFTEFAKGGHPFPTGANLHDAVEPVVLNQNRHATCADCHDAHGSEKTAMFSPPPAIRRSQSLASGISASDGFTVVAPAVNQYENCLRCHGTSTGKVASSTYGYLPRWVVSASDPLNVIPQFAPTASSGHPVTHDRSSPLPQPSLRLNMMNLDGVTSGRPMGTRIFCTDCHNSDDNREFGGSGANGPHGSKWPHILERRYEFSQASEPGAPVVNLHPDPDLSAQGPYALCGKCHDLTQILNNSSFSQHNFHIVMGFSCSVCHTAHGMGSLSGYFSGERMVNFDANVVAPNGISPISYSRSTNSCALFCHGQSHPVVKMPLIPMPFTPFGKGGKVGHK